MKLYYNGRNKALRQSGIELIRIYAILSVIILHYFNPAHGGAINYLKGLDSVIANRLFYTFCFCAVDLFVMISGYFLMSNYKRSLSKIVFLLFQASFIRIVFYFVTAHLHSEPIKLNEVIVTAFSYGYFIVFYSIIYLVSPLFKTSFDYLDSPNCRKAIIILFLFFSILPSLENVLCSFHVLGSDWSAISTITKRGGEEGYSIVNFFLCFSIGGYLKRFYTGVHKLSKELLLLVINSFLLFIWGSIDWKSAWTYDNPLVILEAAFLLLIFADLSFKSKIVNELSTSGFTCYLTHSFFLPYAQINRYASGSWFVLAAHLLLTATIIYFICYLIHKIYKLCFSKIEGKLSPIIDKSNLTIYPVK